MRIAFGTAGGAATEVEDPASVIDAEFLFLKGKSEQGQASSFPSLRWGVHSLCCAVHTPATGCFCCKTLACQLPCCLLQHVNALLQTTT